MKMWMKRTLQIFKQALFNCRYNEKSIHTPKISLGNNHASMPFPFYFVGFFFFCLLVYFVHVFVSLFCF